MRIRLQLRERCKCTVVYYGSFVEAKWELAREAERRRFVKAIASNRTRYEEIETFLELCLLRGVSSPGLPSRGAHVSTQRARCTALRNVISVGVRGKRLPALFQAK